VRISPAKTLAVAVGLFFFTSNLTGSFLPIYFKEQGLELAQIVEILLFTFVAIGLLPLTLLKIVKNFERVISAGMLTTMLFFTVLIYLKSPVILGPAQGVSMATYWPSFNLLQFRLSRSRQRARTISLFSSVIPALASIVGARFSSQHLSSKAWPKPLGLPIRFLSITCLEQSSTWDWFWPPVESLCLHSHSWSTGFQT